MDNLLMALFPGGIRTNEFLECSGNGFYKIYCLHRRIIMNAKLLSDMAESVITGLRCYRFVQFQTDKTFIFEIFKRKFLFSTEFSDEKTQYRVRYGIQDLCGFKPKKVKMHKENSPFFLK